MVALGRGGGLISEVSLYAALRWLTQLYGAPDQGGVQPGDESHRVTVGCNVEGVSYERGTPICARRDARPTAWLSLSLRFGLTNGVVLVSFPLQIDGFAPSTQNADMGIVH